MAGSAVCPYYALFQWVSHMSLSFFLLSPLGWVAWEERAVSASYMPLKQIDLRKTLSGVTMLDVSRLIMDTFLLAFYKLEQNKLD